MSDLNLTSEQAATAEALRLFKNKYRRPPSIGELAQQTGKSRPAAHEMKKRLEEKGITYNTVSDRKVKKEISSVLLDEAMKESLQPVLGGIFYTLKDKVPPEGLRHSAVSALMGLIVAHRTDQIEVKDGSTLQAESSFSEPPADEFDSLIPIPLGTILSEIADSHPESLRELLIESSSTTFHHSLEVLWPTALQFVPEAPNSESTVHRREQGVYLTPPWLARETVNSALQSWLRTRGISEEVWGLISEGKIEQVDKSTNQALTELLRKVTVVDPACGVGTFLHEAFEIIFRLRCTLGKDTDKEKHAKQLIYEQLFGVDRDPLAAALSRAVLFFKLRTYSQEPAEMESVKCGDSILGTPFHDTWGDDLTHTFSTQSLFDDNPETTDWRQLFPSVDERGGFDIVVGNPPWERVKVLSREFFEVRSPELAAAPTSAVREDMMGSEAKELEAERKRKKKYSDALKGSEVYQHSTVGELNLYPLFVERSFQIAENDSGVTALIVPSGIGTKYTYRKFFEKIKSNHLIKFLDFENRNRIFEDVDGRQKFSLMVCTNGKHEGKTEYAFFLQNREDIYDRDKKIYIGEEEIRKINPNTFTLPIVRNRLSMDILKKCHRRVPVIGLKSRNKKEWYLKSVGEQDFDAEYHRLFDMSQDSDLFVEWRERHNGGLREDGFVQQRSGNGQLARVYEGRMISQYDHRSASSVQRVGKRYRRPAGSQKTSLDQHQDPRSLAVPRYLVEAHEVERRLSGWNHDWLLGFMDVGSATNRRTMIATILPPCAAGNKVPLLLPSGGAPVASLLLANLNSFAFDFLLRQHIGGVTLNKYILEQCPVIPKRRYSGKSIGESALTEWIEERVFKLTYTSTDLRGWARDLGRDRPPQEWIPSQRRKLRVELDALYFSLYGMKADEIRHVMDSFHIVKKNEEEEHGSYKLREQILERWQDMVSKLN